MKNTTNKKATLALSLICFFSLGVFGELRAQTADDQGEQDLFEMDLAQLMNVSIVSASKKAESTFDAPFSSSVVTRDEIKRAGCTSIMEAFRLVPALIVREQTNGNFDVHIRGLDNVPPNSVMVNASNTTTLVMIDNRPVYNYLQGGTFWHSLPIDLNDIDRIEVVRGPSAAMYGPNAVSGVIQIITRKPEKDGLYVISNAQAGVRTYLGNASVGYQFNSKLNVGISGNFQNRKRNELTYYEVKSNLYLPADQLPVENGLERYPNPDLSMDKKAINLFANYAPKEKVNFNFAAGLQDAQVQNVFGENVVTPISTNISKTQYADFRFVANNFSGQASYLGGTQDPTVGFTGSKYDFNSVDAYVEYALKLGNITVKPGYNFRRAVYNDTKYWNAEDKEGIISGEKEITTNALSLRSDVRMLNDKLRLFGGIRLDKFNFPDDVHFSYQFASTYNINEKNLIRVVASKANRSPLVYDTYLDLNQWHQLEIPMPPYKLPFLIHVIGDKQLELVKSNMYEAGYRSKIAKNFQLDLDAFYTITTNYTNLVMDEMNFTQFPFSAQMYVMNIPMKVHQIGSTIALNAVFNKIQLKPFVTVQKTELRDYSPYSNTANILANPSNEDPSTNNYLSVSDVKHKSTPAVFGGAYINYQITNKINFNVSPYFYSAQTFYSNQHMNYRNLEGKRGVGEIDPKLILNARISYKPIKSLDVFISGKNILGDTSREFYRSDKIGPNVLGGLNFEF